MPSLTCHILLCLQGAPPRLGTRVGSDVSSRYSLWGQSVCGSQAVTLTSLGLSFPFYLLYGLVTGPSSFLGALLRMAWEGCVITWLTMAWTLQFVPSSLWAFCPWITAQTLPLPVSFSLSWGRILNCPLPLPAALRAKPWKPIEAGLELVASALEVSVVPKWSSSGSKLFLSLCWLNNNPIFSLIPQPNFIFLFFFFFWCV